jgi:hypothetical protein
MRFLIVLAFLLFSPTSLGEEKTSDVTVLHVNTKWNKHQNIDLNGLIGCKVKYGFLEDQSKELQTKIRTVPVIVVFKGNRAIKQWTADLTFRLDVDVNEIQQVIDRL